MLANSQGSSLRGSEQSVNLKYSPVLLAQTYPIYLHLIIRTGDTAGPQIKQEDLIKGCL